MSPLIKVAVGVALFLLFSLHPGVANAPAYGRDQGDAVPFPWEPDGIGNGAITVVAMWLLRAVLVDQKQELTKINMTLMDLTTRAIEGGQETRREIAVCNQRLDELIRGLDLLGILRRLEKVERVAEKQSERRNGSEG